MTVKREQAIFVLRIAGPPVAKARPRATRRGFVYTPAHTRKFEAHSRLSAQLAMDGRPPIDVPVRIELLVELPRAAGASIVVEAQNRRRHHRPHPAHLAARR